MGVITHQAFEAEVREQAIVSQKREALHDPLTEEPAEIWEIRLSRIRDHLTDFYFAYNLPYELFEKTVLDTLAERGVHDEERLFAFNPELAPEGMLFEQAFAIEKLPPKKRTQFEARLREIKVVMIRQLISDQLAYVNIAKDWFTIQDLSKIRQHKIGGGRIGGKAAGMLLAQHILKNIGDEELASHLRVPESYFLGADLTYAFVSLNGLMRWADQKYKTEDQIREEFPQIQREFLAGDFPADACEKLTDLLEQVGKRPLIVRSSSLLEDAPGSSFAGKYESHFCPNQGTPEENLHNLTQAIQRIYASIFNPDALLYRRAKGLQDYDERMAALIQVVEGQQFGRYFMPFGAGVAFSRNLFRWSQQIRREDGFVRLVWGLGTRAVDRVGNDYPRLVALSHPMLHPEASPKAVARYSQRYLDLIDLEDNQFKSLPIHSVLKPRYPGLRYIAQNYQDGYMIPLRSAVLDGGVEQLVITYDELLRRTPFASRLRKMLKILEQEYHTPVDTEFTVNVIEPYSAQPDVIITLLQCRPQSHLKDSHARLPQSIYPEDIVFSTRRVVPEGAINAIRYVVFVSPDEYYSIATTTQRLELVHAIGRLNKLLAGQTFICVGPGRWGTSNPDLGVGVGYADIYNTRAC